jgi:predicted DNA binding CopG/RHH family protein
MKNTEGECIMALRQVPRFQSEQEEADWWDRNRAKLDLDFLEAAGKGQLRRLDREQLKARIAGATKVISLRLPEADLALAREQAARKGLPYQTYLKSLLHEALRRAG